MFSTYVIDGVTLDSLDLKVLLVRQGVRVEEDVCEAFGTTHRVPSPKRNRRKWGNLILPDRTIANVADAGQTTPFHLKLGRQGIPSLFHRDRLVAEVGFPPATALHCQTTSRGLPFSEFVSLQGLDVLVFAYLWPCEFAKRGTPCAYCHCGNYTHQQMLAGKLEEIRPTPEDVAEAVHYAFNIDKCAKHIQITGGSTFRASDEIARYAETLRAINALAGRDRIAGEILVYTTPPENPKEIDILFEANVSRVMCDIEFWDQDCLTEMSPGKARWTGTKRALASLFHITRTHGRGRACSEFVTGYESVESFLDGAELLAANGVVPIPSIWCPHGNPATRIKIEPSLDYFRKLRRGVAELYEKHQLEPPGDQGFNVCFGRDIWNHREELLRAS